MKKSVVFFLLAIFAVGFCDVNAMPKKKKNKGAAADATTSGDNSSATPGANGDSTSANAGAAGGATKVDTPTTAPAPVVSPEPVAAPVIKTTDVAPKADTGAPFDFDKLVADTTVVVPPGWSIDTSRPTDGFYKLTTLVGAKPFPFPDENINNIKKYKRLWRIIDVRDSANKIFAVPGETLIASIMEAIRLKRIIAYKDEEFTKQLGFDKAVGAFIDSVTVNTFDDEGQVTGSYKKPGDFNPDSVTKFEIKEDIYFDKVRGRVVTEIISFAPIKVIKSSAGDYVGETHPFYLYFKQLRKLLAAKEVTDLPRDISNISYDDIFISRNFHSRIIKEASPSGIDIKTKFPKEEDQIRESNRIEQEIKNFKKGLFKFY